MRFSFRKIRLLLNNISKFSFFRNIRLTLKNKNLWALGRVHCSPCYFSRPWFKVHSRFDEQIKHISDVTKDQRSKIKQPTIWQFRSKAITNGLSMPVFLAYVPIPAGMLIFWDLEILVY